VKEFDAATLEVFRRSVGNGPVARIFDRACDVAARDGCEVQGELLRRTPPGYPLHDCTLLRRKGFFVRTETKLPADFYRPKFVSYSAIRFEPYKELFSTLRDIVLEAMRSRPV
jgi:hypothetical protein